MTEKVGDYNPLPKNVTIKRSPIHGLGLFAEDHIPKGELLGMIHYPTVDGDDYVRTPLGGFGNHSEKPNCRKHRLPWQFEVDLYGDKWILITNRYIKSGEEITWKYDFYDPTSPAVA